MDIRKRKRLLKLKPPLSMPQQFSLRSLALCFFFFIFLFLLSHHFRFHTDRYRPTLVVPNLSAIRSVSNSVKDLTSTGNVKSAPETDLWVESRVMFPDSVLVVVKSTGSKRPNLGRLRDQIDCTYHHRLSNGTAAARDEPGVLLGDAVDKLTLRHQALSVDEYDEARWVIRCRPPPVNYSAAVGIHGRNSGYTTEHDWHVGMDNSNRAVNPWDRVAYEAVLDNDTVVVFAKGLNLRSDKESDPKHFSCHFGLRDSKGFPFSSRANTAAQEVFRCPLPRVLKTNMDKIEGVRVTIGMHMNSAAHGHRPANVRGTLPRLLPSVAKIHRRESRGYKKEKSELCACTMVWNQASGLREWISYHAWLGVQRWFIYDNNSDDGLKDVIEELDLENYNVSRHIWPWIKTQEAGFSHCVVRAREECTWVGFFDVDEFFYIPPPRHQGDDINTVHPGRHNFLRAMVSNYSSNETIAEIRTTCHSFGPSGLTAPPPKGLTTGYTCRLLSPERHKSILRPDAVDDTLMNAVHHFRLREGYEFLNLPQSTAVVNHYKYQAWDAFKSKFVRRVSTYVADWHENQKEGSRDRTPGLGTEAIEPSDWHLRFCEIRDTGLKDFVMKNLADPTTGLLPWERPATQ